MTTAKQIVARLNKVKEMLKKAADACERLSQREREMEDTLFEKVGLGPNLNDRVDNMTPEDMVEAAKYAYTRASHTCSVQFPKLHTIATKTICEIRTNKYIERVKHYERCVARAEKQTKHDWAIVVPAGNPWFERMKRARS